MLISGALSHSRRPLLAVVPLSSPSAVALARALAFTPPPGSQLLLECVPRAQAGIWACCPEGGQGNVPP